MVLFEKLNIWLLEYGKKKGFYISLISVFLYMMCFVLQIIDQIIYDV
jgi:hypothetical protein